MRQVAARRKAQPPDQHSRQVGENIAEQVRRYYYVKTLRVGNEPHRQRINMRPVVGDVRAFGGHLLEDLVPQAHRVRECIALRRRGDVFLAVSFSRQLEGVSDDAAAAQLGENPRLQRNLFRLREGRPQGGDLGEFGVLTPVASAEIAVEALGGLADDDKIYLLGRAVRQVPRASGHGLDRAHIGKLLKACPNSQHHASDPDGLRSLVRQAHGTQVDGIETGQYLQRIRRHGHIMLQPVPAPPGKLLEIESYRALVAGALEDLEALGDDLRADAVTRNDRD